MSSTELTPHTGSDSPNGRDALVLDELSTVFARMHGLLLSEETVSSAVRLVADLVADTVGESVGAGVTLVDATGQQTSAGASEDVVLHADALQYDLGEGPCLTAAARRSPVRIDDMTAEQRWPRWTAAAAELGLRSTMSVPLVAGDRALGAMKVYGATAHCFDDADERRLTMFAVQAAVLLANVQSHENARRLSDGLKEALRTRDVIDMAKGVLMHREGVDESTAFAMLVETSSREGRKLRDVASRLLRSATRRAD